MKRELKKLFTSNGVPAGLVSQAIGRVIMIDALETAPKGFYTIGGYFTVHFWMHQDSTSSIAKNAKFNSN